MVINAEYIVAFARYRVSGTTLFCWTALRGGISRLLPAIFSLWSRLPALLQLAGSSNGSPEEIQMASEDDAEGKVWCELLYDPPDGNLTVDVIFIHGLHGSTVKTWRQGDWNKKYKEVQKTSFRRQTSTPEVQQNVCPKCHKCKKDTENTSSAPFKVRNKGVEVNCEVEIITRKEEELSYTSSNHDSHMNKNVFKNCEEQKSCIADNKIPCSASGEEILNNKHVDCNFTCLYNSHETSDSDEDLSYHNARESITFENLQSVEKEVETSYFDEFKDSFYHKLDLEDHFIDNVIKDSKFSLVINSEKNIFEENFHNHEEKFQHQHNGLKKRKSKEGILENLSSDSSEETDCDSSLTLSSKRDISRSKKFFKDIVNCDKEYIGGKKILNEHHYWETNAENQFADRTSTYLNNCLAGVLIDTGDNTLKKCDLNIKDDTNNNKQYNTKVGHIFNTYKKETTFSNNFVISSNKRKHCSDPEIKMSDNEPIVSEKYGIGSECKRSRRIDNSLKYSTDDSDLDDYTDVLNVIGDATVDLNILSMQQAIKDDIDVQSKNIRKRIEEQLDLKHTNQTIHTKPILYQDVNPVPNNDSMQKDKTDSSQSEQKNCTENNDYNNYKERDGITNKDVSESISIDYLEHFFISENEELNLNSDMSFVYPSTCDDDLTKTAIDEEKPNIIDANESKIVSIWKYFFAKRKISKTVDELYYGDENFKDETDNSAANEIIAASNEHINERLHFDSDEIDSFDNSIPEVPAYCLCNSDLKEDGVIKSDTATSAVDVEVLGVDKQSIEDILSDCWPRDWIPMDYPNARVLSISYTTDQYLWRPIWVKPYNRSSLEERTKEMVRQLREYHVGDRPILWVGHSKGGLFIKQIFNDGYECWSSSTKDCSTSDVAKLFLATRGFVFYSVPHRGSPLANLTLPPLLRTSSELWEIQFDGEFVLRLHERFLKAIEGCGDSSPAILSYSETRRTLMGAFYLRIVSPQSADPGVGGMYGVSLDHREICKPSSRDCFLYQEFLRLLKELTAVNS